MITCKEAEKIAVANTLENGKVYYAGDAGDFYIFTIVPPDFPMEIKNPLIGSTFTAVDKKDGHVWVCHVTDPRLKNVKKIAGPNKTK